MRQIVNEIIHPNAVRERGVFLRILGVVGMLPSVAQIHVVADCDHDAPVFIANAAPVGFHAGGAGFKGSAGLDELGSGDLEALLQIVDGVKDGIVVGDVFDGAIGEHALHAGDEGGPFAHAAVGLGAMEVVANEEAAAQ